MILNLPVVAQQQDLKFKSLSLEQGLSQSTVYAILQDSKGFLWIGTQDGLNKYDGYQFTIYRQEPQNANSLSNNEVFALYEDDKGVLWIGTSDGLNQFDRQQDRFIHYFHDPKNPNSLSHNTIWSIYEDRAGQLWIGTHGGGLNKFDRQQNQFVHYQHDPTNPNSLSHNSVWPVYEDKTGTLWIGTDGGGLNRFDRLHNQFMRYWPDAENQDSLGNFISTIYEDQTGILWIGTAGGLYQFDPQQEQFVHYFHDPQNPDTLSHNVISTIEEDNHGRLWIGTDGGGLNRFERQAKKFIHYQNDPKNATSLNNDAVLSTYQDHAGTWWIGTGGGGLNRCDCKPEKFVHYFHDPQNPKGLNNNHIWSLHEDREGLLWVGTQGGGLNKFDSRRKEVTHYLHDSQNSHSLSHNDVLSMTEDSTGTLWIGTAGGGLNAFDRKSNQFVSYLHDNENPNSLIHNYVLSIYADSTNTLWIGTREGLDQFDRQQQQFVHHFHDPKNPNSLSHNEIYTLYEDKTGTLWIGTAEGLNQFDRRRRTFTRYQHDPNNINSLSHPEISAIYADRRGTLWIGTFGGGLNQFDPVTKTFTHYRESDGLANDVIYGILEDKKGYLWLSSNKGLSKFHPQTKEVRNYDVLDGLQSLEFNSAYFKSRRGELFFGGINGFNAFYPEQVKDNSYLPPIVITNFEIFNQPVPLGGDSPLQQHISETTELILSYQQSFFSFEFAALNFLQPNRNQYSYILEGFDNDWNYVGTRRNAYYTNVPYGNYVFHVKGSNNDNVWNEKGTAIKITILPPPWKTWWAYTLYVITVLILIIKYVQSQKQKLREKQQELERERAIAAQLKETNKLKDEFLANTSHELRTPLNGIIGITESLIDGATGSLNQQTHTNLVMIVSSARRLLNLVNDILDFSKIKQKEVNLQLKAVDMRTIAEVVLTLSRPLIGHQEVQLTNAISPDLPPINADENRVQQILYNLVGNAIKFTDSGSIEVSAQIVDNFGGDEKHQGLAITVSDSGIGIAAEKMGRIFEAFEQADGSTARIYGGTGLGLAVTQQLVKLHGGELQVQSQVGKGSQFTFTLPLSEGEVSPTSTAITSEEIAQTSTAITSQLPITQAPLLEPEPPFEPELSKPDSIQGQYNILIVDDEPVNRQVLINHLSLQNYMLTQATSGPEALALLAEGFKPDLILLDVMMPHMTGYEVTQKIRENLKINELPILLLTAKNQVTDLVTGLEMGANDYLTKPVSKEELIARIKTHINIQQLRAENLRMGVELNVTRRLQQMLLPTEEELNQVAGLEIAGFMQSADEVAGDYYDVLQCDGRVIFGIGDVTGHGLESGVLMLMAQTAVRTLLENGETDPLKFLNTLNRTLYKNVQQRMTVDKSLTLSLLEYWPRWQEDGSPSSSSEEDVAQAQRTGGILQVSGQHEEIIVIRNHGCLEIISTENLGFMIGFMEDVSDLVAKTEIQLNSGDLVVLYTDGITEAENLDDEYYGLERLCEVIKQHQQQSVQEICQVVIEDVRQYIGKQKIFDDITLLIFRQQ